MKRVASPGSMHDTGCLGLVHWDDPEGWYGEGEGRRVQDGEHMYICVSMLLGPPAFPRDNFVDVGKGKGPSSHFEQYISAPHHGSI